MPDAIKTKRFSTFEGVFTPSLLSILGVIMYLRLGWVVGSVGFIGAAVIIILANSITLLTSLSMSSVVTNIRIGAGGAYSIITKSLGVEAGGAIGLPLYISQAISVAFYITGFSEAWLFVFPHHNPLMISLVTWGVLLIVSYASAKLAFRIQFVIMGLILLSIISIVLGKGDSNGQIFLWSMSGSGNFWHVFAIFFPAVTGILAGASMSGELTDPKRSIPMGTLFAVLVGFVVYLFLAFLFAKEATQNSLLNSGSIAMDIGKWKGLVVAGIMGATISSALSMFVGAPRVLMALGKHNVVPLSSSFSHINKRGEPTTAILFTSFVTLVTILFGNLNQIAGLLTMFFLITYGMINLTVFIEQTIGITSFRPSFKVWRVVPFLGSASCLFVMFLINVKFSIIAILLIIIIYSILLKRGVNAYSPDVRSGMLVFFAELFARGASKLPYYPKIWKPNILIPANNLELLPRIMDFIRSVVEPAGRVTAFRVIDPEQIRVPDPEEDKEPTAITEIATLELDDIVKPLRSNNIFVETTSVESAEISPGIISVMQTVKGMFFPPNTLLYALEEDSAKDFVAQAIIHKASEEGLGIMLLGCDIKMGFNQENIINLWIRRQSPNFNLAVLIALQLEKNWDGELRIVHVVKYEQEKQEAYDYLVKMRNLMRLSDDVEIHILVGEFQDIIKEAPVADINIFGMQEQLNIHMVREIQKDVETSVLFLKDSKHESALA